MKRRPIRMKKEIYSQKRAQQIEKLQEERGTKALKRARKIMLQEAAKIECEDIEKALKYFMNEYWSDKARPTLLSLASEAVGGDQNITLPIAVPLILISGAIDIHDDIIDQSTKKQNQLTVLGRFGKDIALLSGNALLFKGLMLLHGAYKRIPSEKMDEIVKIIKDLFFELGDAEALELGLRGRLDLTPEECLLIVKKKAADVESCTRIGARLGGGSKEEIKALCLYGRLLGETLILRDELMDTANYDELLHRIKKEHLPLPVVYALQDSKYSFKLRNLLSKKELTKRDAKKIFNLTYESHGIQKHIEFMKSSSKKAINAIQNLKIKDHLESLALDVAEIELR